jgi:class 3 adenylate cyclase/tetratricopeptide (TPR) repeat protein
VTVLFCDLVGFTGRAARLDPEDVRRMLSPYYARLRRELERHGGTVEKFIGDAVMALFGAPVAHEDDPERAVRAALAIREALREEDSDLELHVRIAVTTGEAVVALGARPSDGEGMASGDVVNTCARLQAAAPADGILVDETTYRATDRVIEYREVKPVTVKGKAEPIAVWEAVAARARLGVDVVQRAPAPLVGRREELDLLTGALARARREAAPQLVTLIGVPGIGKSRLVWELFRSVEADPELIYWRQGRSLPYGAGVTYWALGEMVKAQAGILETDREDSAAEKLRGTVTDLVPEPADARWIEGHLRPLVGLGADTEPRGDRRGEAFAAWRRFLEALAERGPTVLVFEDLHWADDGLLDFVEHLVDWASSVPLLVVGTARPELLERRPGWGGGKLNSTTISLSRLSDEDTARLVAALLEKSVLEAGVQRAVLAHAGGNPLYAEEYVRMLRDRPWTEELPLPETVQGIIAARLDTLAPEEKALLQNAAVVGKVVWVGALAAIGERPRWEVEERLHSLERKEFVQRARRTSVASETEYAFRHALVREVAYGQMPRSRRGEKHRLAAAWIESLGRSEDHAEMLAHHYLAALELARAAGEDASALAEPARIAIREAGDRAAALNSFTAATRYHTAALELWPADDPLRALLLFAYGVNQNRADSTTGWDALSDARDALLELGNREAAAEAETRLGDILWRRGQQEAAFEWLESAASLLADAPSSPSKTYVSCELSRLHMLAGHYDAAVQVGTAALAMAEALGLEESRAEALNNIGSARLPSGDPGGFDDLERALAIARSINSQSAIQRALINLGVGRAMMGDLEGSFELVEEAWQRSRKADRAESIRWNKGELVVARYYQGRWEEAADLADELIAESEAGPRHYQEMQTRETRGRIRIARGDVEGALRDAAQALVFARPAKDPQALLPSLAFAVEAYVAAGRREQAAQLARELLDGVGESLYAATWVAPAAPAFADLGLGHQLAERLGRHGAVSRWVAAARAILDGDSQAAAEIYAAIGALPEEAGARLRSGEPEHVQRALAFYRSVGATACVRRGEALLAATA